ncbi:MAG: hypothetical protein LBP59_19335 [Planctomycetaceae bacterium]|nr:hypothetical protein [Planctomycetaceae bacterium]
MIRFFCFVLLFVYFVFLEFSFLYGQAKIVASKPESPIYKAVKLPDINSRFIVSIIPDGNNGAWIGTESDGVFHYENNKTPTHICQQTYRMTDNNAYALASDKLGRLWIGHLNEGVSIFCNNKLQPYDIVDGPIGERIFDIAICPVDGDVWLATSAGITRYQLEKNKWEHFTRADGLLEDQIAAIAFKNDGTLIAGTQCYGIAIFNRNKKGEYKHARNIFTQNRFGARNCSPVPLTYAGNGLPSNQINDIIVTKNNPDGKEYIWIATSAGLAKSDSDFGKIIYWRGKNYADKIRGLYGGAPKDFKQAPPEKMNDLLPEDYITTLAEDDNGNLIYGTWTKGLVIFDPQTNHRIFCNNKSANLPDNYITAICPMPDGQYLTGSYGGGVVLLQKTETDAIISVTKNNEQITPNANNSQKIIPLPTPQQKLDIDELYKLSHKLATKIKKTPKVYAKYWADDWKTGGDWFGRISNEWAILCATSAPLDRYVYHSRNFYNVTGFIGPNHNANDDLRRWVYKIETDDERAPYDPLNGNRRFSEWDDHGEAYAWSKDGPDLWYVLEINHSGVFRLGMYFVNMDGHDGSNRWRDYLIEIYPSDKGCSAIDSDRQVLSKYAESQIATVTPLARTRVKNFWNGVYKNFIVNGPAKYLVKIDRNYSFNTIMSGIFIQQIHGEPTDDTKFGIPKLYAHYYPPTFPDYFEDAESRVMWETWIELDKKWINDDAIDCQWKYRVAVYVAATRAAQENEAPDDVKKLAKCLKWRLNQWDAEQRSMWNYMTKLGYEKLLNNNPQLKEQIKKQNKENIPEFMKDWPK